MDVFRDYSSLTFIGLPHTFFYVGSMKRPFLIKGRTYVFINSVDGLLRHQINRPNHQDSSYCFNQEVGSKHLEHGISAYYSCKGYQRKEAAIHRKGEGIGDKNPSPLRPHFSCAVRPTSGTHGYPRALPQWPPVWRQWPLSSVCRIETPRQPDRCLLPSWAEPA